MCTLWLVVALLKNGAIGHSYPKSGRMLPNKSGPLLARVRKPFSMERAHPRGGVVEFSLTHSTTIPGGEALAGIFLQEQEETLQEVVQHSTTSPSFVGSQPTHVTPISATQTDPKA